MLPNRCLGKVDAIGRMSTPAPLVLMPMEECDGLWPSRQRDVHPNAALRPPSEVEVGYAGLQVPDHEPLSTPRVTGPSPYC